MTETVQTLLLFWWGWSEGDDGFCFSCVKCGITEKLLLWVV
ncbi:hypothetical protein Hanom_Chr13g01201251 [Helianthus anomalus]